MDLTLYFQKVMTEMFIDGIEVAVYKFLYGEWNNVDVCMQGLITSET